MEVIKLKFGIDVSSCLLPIGMNMNPCGSTRNYPTEIESTRSIVCINSNPETQVDERHRNSNSLTNAKVKQYKYRPTTNCTSNKTASNMPGSFRKGDGSSTCHNIAHVIRAPPLLMRHCLPSSVCEEKKWWKSSKIQLFLHSWGLGRWNQSLPSEPLCSITALLWSWSASFRDLGTMIEKTGRCVKDDMYIYNLRFVTTFYNYINHKHISYILVDSSISYMATKNDCKQ